MLSYLALQEPEPGVTIETISDTDVFDLHRPLRQLEIVFQDQNIEEQGLNLRIVTILVKNSGRVNILPIHYDQEDVWGIKFRHAKVIEARLVGASSEYLQSKVIPQRSGVDTVAFPKDIFEKGASFTIEALLLHPKNESPAILPVGKIAGINKIPVSIRPLAQEEISFFAQVFRGSVLVQVARAITYLLGSFIAIGLLIVVMVGITDLSDRLTARKRRDRISQTLAINQIDQDEIKNILVELYASAGISGLNHLHKLIQEPGVSGLPITQDEHFVIAPHQTPDVTSISRDNNMILQPFGLYGALEALSKIRRLTVGADSDSPMDQKMVETIKELVAELEN